MGHLLSSVNPEAAERIENPTMGAPDIGTPVVYIARAGFQRMGRHEFPASVLGHDEEGHLSLLVTMEPEDMMMEDHVRPQMSDEGHTWRHVEMTVPDDVLEMQEIISAQAEHIEALGLELADLKKIVLGDYKPAKLSVYELLAEFEAKLPE